MTTIRTTCPQCGEVDMTPEAILLYVRREMGEGAYRFSCPECQSVVEKPADRKIVALLLSVGVELAEPSATEPEGKDRRAQHRRKKAVERESMAPEAGREEERRPTGPPLTIDDLIDFHFLLSDDERLHRYLPNG